MLTLARAYPRPPDASIGESLGVLKVSCTNHALLLPVHGFSHETLLPANSIERNGDGSEVLPKLFVQRFRERFLLFRARNNESIGHEI